MFIVKIVFQILLLLAIIFTGLQLSRRDEWWVRVADFPHSQLTVVTFFALIGNIILADFSLWSDMSITFFGSLALIYQFCIIYPYTKLSPKQSKDCVDCENKPSLSILESNIYMYNENYYKFVNVCKKYDPDIVIALETDVKWQKGLKSLEDNYKYLIHHPLDNTYGLLIYSKLEILKSQIQFLIEEDIPSVEADLRLDSGEVIRLFVIHPQPPSPTENYRSTERDAELIVVGRKARNSPYPVLVAGDLNDVAWSHTTRLFQRISKLLDPRIGRGFFNTFHAKYRLLRWPLDHVFHSSDFMIKRIERAPFIESDHFPMFIEFSLEPVKGAIRNGKTDVLTEEDIEESEETLEKARE